MFKIIAKITAKKKKEVRTYNEVWHYGEVFWLWLRKFIKSWFYILLISFFFIFNEAFFISTTSSLYSYGLYYFWVFYLPVFGLFLTAYYYNYTSDGFWCYSAIIYYYVIKYFKNLS